MASNEEIQKASGGQVNETIQEAINKSDIEGIQREQIEQNRRLALLEKRINWIFTTIIITLLVGIVNLTIHLIGYIIAI